MLRLSLFSAALVIGTGAQAQDLATGQGRLEIAGQAPTACVLNAPIV